MSLFPLFPLNIVLFPNSLLPIHIFEERYKKMIGDCLSKRSNFGVILIKSGSEVEGPAVPHSVGCEAEIVHTEKMEDGRINILVKGARRFRILRLDQSLAYLQAEVLWLPDSVEDPDKLHLLASELQGLFKEYEGYLRQFGTLYKHSDYPEPTPPEDLSFRVANKLQLELLQKQDLLEIPSTGKRLRKEISMLQFFRKRE
ncbi:MAG: LON peptidase substrate-binding domain-containing protein [Candidatus Bathyarchaeia archaeon]